jgi:hypothetical protein
VAIHASDNQRKLVEPAEHDFIRASQNDRGAPL